MEKNKKGEDKYNFLLYVPIIKHKDFEEKDGKIILYFKANHPIQKLASWLIKKSLKRDITLDEMGSEVWRNIDGNNSIYEISKIMAKKLNDSEEDSISRILQFIRYISKRGWISFKEVKTSK